MELCYGNCNDFTFRFVTALLFTAFAASLPDDWERLSDTFLTGANIGQLDAGISESIWALNLAGKPHVKVGLEGQWSEVNDLKNAELSWVSSGAAGVWAIRSNSGSPVYREGISAQSKVGTEWSFVEGRGFKIIESGLPGCVYALTRTGELYYRDGISELNKKGSSWKQIWGKYRFLSAGSYGVWTVDFFNRIYFGKGSSAHLSLVKNWEKVDNPSSFGIQSVVAGFDGSVWCLVNDGSVFKRTSVNILNPSGNFYGWKRIDGLNLRKITAGLPGVIGVTNDQQVVVHRDRKCGGLLQERSGTFETPNYPNSYPSEVVCLWVIRVPKAKSIIVTIETFDIGKETGDFLAYSKDGSYPSTQEPVRINNPGTQELTFQGETALFEFFSDGKINAKGFLARYSSDLRQNTPAVTESPMTPTPFSGCGGSLYTNSGSITSPNYPNNYDVNIDCTWIITVQPGNRIKFSVNDMNIEFHGECRYDYLRIGDGSRKGQNIRDTICGERRYDFVSRGNQMWVRFFSDSQVERKGFKASWSVEMLTTTTLATTTATKAPDTTTQRPLGTTPYSGCGGSIFQSSGSIVSPNYPNNYDSSLDCTWIITVQPGKRIKFSVNDMNIEFHGECRYDYLRIGDGSRKGQNIRDTICGERRYDFVSRGNQMWVRFFSDSQVERKGFKASWSVEMLTTTMQTTTTATATNPFSDWRYISRSYPYKFVQIDAGMTDHLVGIDSQGFPSMRPNNNWSALPRQRQLYASTGDSGTWAVDKNNQVRYLLPTGASVGDSWDYVGSDFFKSIDSGPKGYVFGVRSNGMLVYRDGISSFFPSGRQWVNLGQSLKSVSVGSYGIWGVDEFGKVYFARRPSDLKVFPISWRPIQGPFITKIDAGFGNQVWGLTNTGQVVKRVGVSHDTPFGISWAIQKEFLKDITVGSTGVFGLDNDGMVLEKKDKSDICGGILTASSGNIVSPGYPLVSYTSVHCLWIIRVPSAQSIRLDISYFNIYKTENCLDDYILLYKRGYYSPEYGTDRFCGTERNISPSITYNGNEVWLQFNAGSQSRPRSYRGFDIRYVATVSETTTKPATTVTSTVSLAPSTPPTTMQSATRTHSGCGGDLTANFGSLTSPGFPSRYRNNLVCIWQIKVHPSRELSLKFDQFSVEDDSRCQYDFLLIKTSENGRELGRFCGTRSQPDITVGGNSVWLYFKTDTSMTKTGFRMVWSSKLKPGLTDPPVQTTKATTQKVKPTQKKEEPITVPKLPDNWLKVEADIQFAHIDGGISPNAWGVDVRNNPYVQDGRNWRFAGPDEMIWVTSGGSGVWGINSLGKLFYRRGVAPLAPKGSYWEMVTAPRLYRVDSGPMGALLVLDDIGQILLREGITMANPVGTFWSLVGVGYKSLSIGSYGYWAVNDREEVFVATIAREIPITERLRWTRVDGRFDQVKAGFGSSVWAVSPDGDLYERKGINAITPRGLSWKRVGNVRVNGVSTGMSGVFATIQGTNQLITRPDRICGDLFTAQTGTFSTPQHPLSYPENTTCLWQIKVEGASKIIVEFDSFQLEESQSSPVINCNSDYLLYLRDGQFPSAYGAKKRCGRDDAPIIFEGDKAWIEFVSDDANNFPGFLARYRAIVEVDRVTESPVTTKSAEVTTIPTTQPVDIYRGCGGLIDATIATSGQFAHSNYPLPYSSSQSCEYIIRTNPGRRIHLDFDLLDIESSSQCRFDVMEIRDGDLANDKLIGRYCGKIDLKGITSTGNALFLKFKSDSTEQSKGYLARWRVDVEMTTTKQPETTTGGGLEGPKLEEIMMSCGGTIDATKKRFGYFAHMNYPDQYSNNANCVYVIKAAPGRKIKLKFEKFALEPHETCRFDALEVRGIEGPQPTKKFCGKELPRDIVSSGNTLTVQFTSDIVTAEEGFLIRWDIEIDNTLPTVRPTSSTAKKDESPITDCGGTFRTENGLFATPNYPGDYAANLDCQWKFIVGENKVIQLTFEFFDLEKSGAACGYDYVQAFDVVSNKDINIGKYCDNKPDEIISSGNELKVIFHSDSSTNKKGFVARWSTKDVQISTVPFIPTTKQPCMYSILGLGGEFGRGGESSFYEPNENCSWLIKVRSGRVARIELLFFDIENSFLCAKDSLRIYDGLVESSPAIANLCGNSPAKRVFYSSGNQLRVVFKTDGTNNVGGFKIRWSAVSPLKTTSTPTTVTMKKDLMVDICDTSMELISRESGTMTSQNYPNNYPSSQSCLKVIETSADKQLVVSFEDFALEPSIRCQNDALFVGEGDFIQSLCGYNKPAEIKSPSNRLRFTFKSDVSTQGRGFKLKWRSVPKESIQTLPDAPSCGGRLYGSTGLLESPKFDRRYPFTITCTWILEVGPKSAIDFQLDTAKFDNSSCGSHLLFRETIDSTSKLIKKYCQDPGFTTFESQGNLVYIEHKIEKDKDSMFRFTWRERTDNSFRGFPCGGIQTKPSGFITSPGHPSPYPNNLFCTWIIVAPKGNKIAIEFPRFKLEQDDSCSKDYLTIRNGFSSESAAVGRYCGVTIPKKVLSTGNSIWIRLKTDCKTSFSGFTMSWTFVKDDSMLTHTTPFPSGSTQTATTTSSVDMGTSKVTTTKMTQQTTKKMETTTKMTSRAPQTTPMNINVNAHGGLITGQGGIIQSPYYPRPYPNNADLTWVLKGPADGRIAIEFSSFLLEEDSACRYDYVELRDGSTSDSPSIGKFCGGNLPATFTSADNSLYIKFKSDLSENHAGFQAKWKWLPSGVSLPASRTERRHSNSVCGGILTKENGEISTPNYPEAYSSNSECIWIIKPASGRSVQLSFKSFNLESESRCGYDYVEVRDGESGQSARLGKFCGSSLPNIQYSSKGALWIRFKSDSSTNDLGFIASWRTVSKKRRRRDIKPKRIGASGCSFALGGNEGKLKLKRGTNFYRKMSGKVCTWTIKATNKNSISLHIDDLGFKRYVSCSTNYMDVYAIRGEKHVLIAHLCPITRMLWRKGFTISTRSRRIFIKYVREGKNHRDLKVKWTTSSKND